jgi:hypothetical protein
MGDNSTLFYVPVLSNLNPNLLKEGQSYVSSRTYNIIYIVRIKGYEHGEHGMNESSLSGCQKFVVGRFFRRRSLLISIINYACNSAREQQMTLFRHSQIYMVDLLYFTRCSPTPNFQCLE